jgi:hypothetical protein
MADPNDPERSTLREADRIRYENPGRGCGARRYGELGHSHSQQVFNRPVDPSGLGIIRKQAKGDT